MLTLDDIIDRIDAFNGYARRVQELKDRLLEISTLSPPGLLETNERFRIETTEEIGRIYQENMVPIMEELMGHVEENAGAIRQALNKLAGKDLEQLVDRTLCQYREQRISARQYDDEAEGFELTLE